MKGKIRYGLGGLLLLIPLIVLWPRGNDLWMDTGQELLQALTSGAFGQSLEAYVNVNFPFRNSGEELGVNLRYLGGKREQNGVFLSRDGLVKNIDAPTGGIAEQNTEAVLEFARYLRSVEKPFYFSLIPTASGVLTQNLPQFAQIFDQRRFIEDVYGEMTGKLTTVDTYIPLSSNRDQYLFYRTENNLTAYGGYYVYAAMARRMRVADNPDYNAFDIGYAKYGYLGDLYSRSPYEQVESDVLILYKYSRYPREYTVAHKGPDGVKLYHTLFPEHLRELDRDMDVYLGGLSAVVEVKTSAPYDRKLLVFGDKTALAYLPFLVNHYHQVTFVDLFHSDEAIGAINVEDYDQVLMAYSVETYISPPAIPARAALFIEE